MKKLSQKVWNSEAGLRSRLWAGIPSICIKKMCKGGQIVFVEFSVGESEYGDELSKWLEDILGNDIVFILYDDLVYWKNVIHTLE